MKYYISVLFIWTLHVLNQLSRQPSNICLSFSWSTETYLTEFIYTYFMYFTSPNFVLCFPVTTVCSQLAWNVKVEMYAFEIYSKTTQWICDEFHPYQISLVTGIIPLVPEEHQPLSTNFILDEADAVATRRQGYIFTYVVIYINFIFNLSL